MQQQKKTERQGKPPVVIYHGNCWDGFCAAWILHKVFPDAEFIPAQYGQDPPEAAEDKTRRLFIVDFSYPANVMFRLGAMRCVGTQMTVLDHHKTAQAALDGLDLELASNNCGGCEVVFDMDKSGGRLTWDYCCQMYLAQMLPAFPYLLHMPDASHGLCPSPWLVNYTEDRDLWRWSIDDSREVTAALRTYPLEFDLWDEFERDEQKWRNQMREEGLTIRRYEQLLIDQHVRHAREIELDGHKILAVNATVLFSDIAGTLAEGRPFGAAYVDREDGKRQWSLRSRDEGVDVSEIAKAHGGGGHRNAAGFEEQAQ